MIVFRRVSGIMYRASSFCQQIGFVDWPLVDG